MAKNITIALIGCAKRKHVIRDYARARDLYDSDLFRKRVAHVENRNLPWYILSAKSGLLSPTVQIRTYDKVITELSGLEIAEWHVGTANQLFTELYYTFDRTELSGITVELHAGKRYCEPLGAILKLFGVNVVKPVEGLGIGEQLAYYGRKVDAA